MSATIRIRANTEFNGVLGQPWRLLVGEIIENAEEKPAKAIVVESNSMTIGPEEVPGVGQKWHLITEGNLVVDDTHVFTIKGKVEENTHVTQEGGRSEPRLWKIFFNKMHLLSPGIHAPWICQHGNETLGPNEIHFEVPCWTHHINGQSFIFSKGVAHFDGTTLFLRKS